MISRWSRPKLRWTRRLNLPIYGACHYSVQKPYPMPLRRLNTRQQKRRWQRRKNGHIGPANREWTCKMKASLNRSSTASSCRMCWDIAQTHPTPPAQCASNTRYRAELLSMLPWAIFPTAKPRYWHRWNSKGQRSRLIASCRAVPKHQSSRLGDMPMMHPEQNGCCFPTCVNCGSMPWVTDGWIMKRST